MTMNPDLVFDDGQAVGDVKYKRAGTEWNRPDLYQAIAFAKAFGSQEAVVIDFANNAATRVVARVGSKAVHHFSWRTDLPPDDALDALVLNVSRWLTTISAARAA